MGGEKNCNFLPYDREKANTNQCILLGFFVPGNKEII